MVPSVFSKLRATTNARMPDVDDSRRGVLLGIDPYRQRGRQGTIRIGPACARRLVTALRAAEGMATRLSTSGSLGARAGSRLQNRAAEAGTDGVTSSGNEPVGSLTATR